MFCEMEIYSHVSQIWAISRRVVGPQRRSWQHLHPALSLDRLSSSAPERTNKEISGHAVAASLSIEGVENEIPAEEVTAYLIIEIRWR